MKRALAAGITAMALTIGGCSADTPPSDRASPTTTNAPVTETTQSAQPEWTPTTLTLPGSASAPIVTITTNEDGVLLPPKNVARIGWWKHSDAPGDGVGGTIVMTGHINGDGQIGFAEKFIHLQAGNVVTLSSDNGAGHRYVVQSVEHYDKASGTLPTDRLNRLQGPEQLALITCGGEFVGAPLGYADNVIAWAIPV